MKLSGRMTRSTDECEMSRSCQRAMFSSAAIALARSSRARPDDLLAADRVALVRHRRRALLPLAERLLDLADLGLLQTADLERELLERGRGDRERRQQLGVAVALDHLRRDRRGLAGRAARRPAPRSRDRDARRCRPRRKSCRPTTTSRARSTRSRLRCSSAYQSASFRPNVIGSACTPCVRPIIGVRRCSSARSRTASISAADVLDDQRRRPRASGAPGRCR